MSVVMRRNDELELRGELPRTEDEMMMLGLGDAPNIKVAVEVELRDYIQLC